MTYRMIQVGAGGHGASWCRHFLPPNVKDGLIEVVAAVDTSPAALQNARDGLGLREDQCYTDMAKAFGENKADFCTIVVPPQYHEDVVDLALAHDLHILSEKPIAHTLASSLRIAAKVKSAGKKMAVTMSHRFDQDKTTLRQQLRSGELGPLDYLVCRFTVNVRRRGIYTPGVYVREDPMMVEMAVHHLDILADLAGALCETIYAQTWNPSWSEYQGDPQGMAVLRFSNGVRASYEAANTNAAGLNTWAQEYIRAECERATLILDHRRLERFAYDPAQPWATAREGQGEEIPLLQQSKWANAWLIEQFVQWLDGGPVMETEVEANLQSMGLVAAGIESAQTGQAVRVQEFLAPREAEEPVTVVRKVLAYITRPADEGLSLLVHTHRDFPEAGLQVPAGTVEAGETPEQALYREVWEESGLTGLTLVGLIKTYEWWNPHKQAWQRRHVFHLDASSGLPAHWNHLITGEGNDHGLVFAYRWLPVVQAREQLAAEQGRSLTQLMNL